MERKAADIHAMTNWHLDEALRSSDLKRTQTEEHFVRAGVAKEGGKQFTVIVMILTSLNSPEERVFLRGALRDSRKLDHGVVFYVCVRKSGHSGFSFLRGCSTM